MVYCDYRSHTDDTATYAYGETIDDITGVLVFHFGKEEGIEIIKKPERHGVIGRQINSLYGIHREEFKKGIFKEKIAYEV
jgi:hypothetical protein